MPDSCLAERLGELVELTSTERIVLADLEGRDRTVRRGAALVRENDRMGELFVLRRGMVMSYVLLDDGSRQILRFYFPGDVLASSALAYRKSPENIVALIDSSVSSFDRSASAKIASEHPRLMALFAVINQIAHVTLTDRLAALGRTSAKARISALLLEIRNGMRQGNRAIQSSFPLVLTQEEIGDATGLTAVHVNRMLRQLEEEGKITRQGGVITLVDEERLWRAANYLDRRSGLDLSWLPAGR